MHHINRCENNLLSPLGIDQWPQYKQYFKINVADFIITVILLQRKQEVKTGELFLFQNKRDFKIRDCN